MKKNTLNLMLIGTMLIGLSACNSNMTTHDDSVDTAQKMNEAMTDNNSTANNPGQVTEDDTKFAVMAADAGMAEVELGKLALSKSSNADVKQYAQMMVDDHTAANNKLMTIAASKQITLPTAISDKHKKHVEDMSKMSGKDFDKHYVDMMVDDHGEVVDAFKKENENTKDAELKSFTSETLPTLMKHHDQAKALKDKMK
jgi:putative membrane protein